MNQLTNIGAASLTYDARGNLIADGSRTYGYDSENRLVSASGGVSLAYDPLGRLAQVSGPAGTTRFLWDGLDLVGEYNAAGVLQKRYVHGDRIDEPLAAYGCASLGWSCRTYPQQDERGSIISIVNADASVAAINRYDEFGKPQGGSIAGRFGYTGQLWIGEVGAYYYKARFYSPALGRFLQADPVGYEDSPNLYAYVLNDPVNLVDPLGLQVEPCDPKKVTSCGDIPVTGYRDLIPLSWTFARASGIDLFFEGGGSAGSSNNAQCAAALNEAKKDQAAIQRANQSWSIISSAATAHEIQPSLLAAIGVRETGFKNIPEVGGGFGVGVFQLTVKPGSGVTVAQAFNVPWAANYAASMLQSNMGYFASRYSFTASQLLQATAASFNLGRGGISGDPVTIDVGSTWGNYGSNVVNLMSCFQE